MHKHFYYAICAGVIAGFYLAGAKTGTGIYANAAVGQTAANIYVAGAKMGAPATAAAATTATRGARA